MIELEPIGVVRSGRTEPVDDDWDAVAASIELDARRFEPSALRGLEAFSHVEVVYLFDRVDPARVVSPRGPRSS